jgi:Nucleotidyl transferase AbiEii toxin, Type IV TA system
LRCGRRLKHALKPSRNCPRRRNSARAGVVVTRAAYRTVCASTSRIRQLTPDEGDKVVLSLDATETGGAVTSAFHLEQMYGIFCFAIPMAKRSQSAEKSILDRIRGHGRGWVFTPRHFMDLASRPAITSALRRQTAAGTIRPLGRGLNDCPTMQPPVLDYLKRSVKLEVGSLTEQRPTASHAVRPWIADLRPKAFGDWQCDVVALNAHRSFWEKVHLSSAVGAPPFEGCRT